MKVAIIGHGDDKFTDATRAAARASIGAILDVGPDVVISGRSPVGGIDVWAEEMAAQRGIPTDIKAPHDMSWGGLYGFRARNLDIAQAADEVHVILVAEYPPNYSGRRFDVCYHCKGRQLAPTHVKSGACWTASQALKMGKHVVWHVL